MDLIHKTILLEANDWKYLKSQNINISQFVRDSLRQLVSLKKGTIEGINIELTRLSLDKNRKEMVKLQAQIKNDEELLEKAEKLNQEKEQNRLQKEKEQIEKQSKCMNCGKTLDEQEKRPFPAGVVCRPCYLSADKDMVKKWMMKVE